MARTRRSQLASSASSWLLPASARAQQWATPPAPPRLLGCQLAPARVGDGVERGAAPRLVQPPLRGDQAALLDPVERRIERGLLHAETLVGHPANGLEAAVAVQRAERDGPQDQHVDRALQLS